MESKKKPGKRGPSKYCKGNYAIGFVTIPATTTESTDIRAYLLKIRVKYLGLDPDNKLFCRIKIPRGWMVDGNHIRNAQRKIMIRMKIPDNTGVPVDEITFPSFIIV